MSLLLFIQLTVHPAITDHFEAFIKYEREHSFKVLSVPANLTNTCIYCHKYRQGLENEGYYKMCCYFLANFLTVLLKVYVSECDWGVLMSIPRETGGFINLKYSQKNTSPYS